MAMCGIKRISAVCLLFLQILVCNATTDTKSTRKLDTSIICNSTNATHDAHLIHTKAVGSEDILHYVFSTIGVPSILVVRTNLTGEIQVDCPRILSNNVTETNKSIDFTGRHYGYSLMFNRLIEYNDTDDDADLTKVPYNNETWRSYDLSDITWDPLDESSDIESHKVVFKVQNDQNGIKFKGNGSLSLSMQVVGEYTREDLLPHLEYNYNMTHLNLVLDNITTKFTAARFAIEMTLVSSDPANNMMLNKAQYIDDEHSPGVFEMVDWTADGVNQDWSGFLQFKPVCYTSPERSLGDATKAFYYDLVQPNSTDPEVSLAYALFGDEMFGDKYSRTMANVSFGLSKDKFYPHTNYTVWSASVGFGKPPSDQLSLLIIIILSVGLGLPIILISFGSVGICIRKKLKAQTHYVEISSSSPEIN